MRENLNQGLIPMEYCTWVHQFDLKLNKLIIFTDPKDGYTKKFFLFLFLVFRIDFVNADGIVDFACTAVEAVECTGISQILLDHSRRF